MRIFVNVRQLMHPRMVFEVRSAWLQRGGRLGQGFHRFQGHWSSGHLYINIASKQMMIETLMIDLRVKRRENKTKNVQHQYHWQCNMLFTCIYFDRKALAVCGQNILSIYQSITHSHMSINTRRELTMG